VRAATRARSSAVDLGTVLAFMCSDGRSPDLPDAHRLAAGCPANKRWKYCEMTSQLFYSVTVNFCTPNGAWRWLNKPKRVAHIILLCMVCGASDKQHIGTTGDTLPPFLTGCCCWLIIWTACHMTNQHIQSVPGVMWNTSRECSLC